MKKSYAVYIDDDAYKTVKGFLDQTGQSFSGFVNGLLVEFAKQIKGQPTAFDKPVEQMSVKEFAALLGYWFKNKKTPGLSLRGRLRGRWEYPLGVQGLHL
jgi:hypothetical protein